MRYDETIIDTDAGLLPLQTTGQSAALIPPAQLVAGQVRSIAGQLGPDLNVATAAALNGVAISFAAAANLLTFGLTGIGTMAQRNAVASVADVATADATDLATVIALANDLKAKLNELLAKARTANHLVP